jgi:alginate O-acetyltransferase complex protein AlgI
MFFTSFDYAIFLFILYLIYWVVLTKSIAARNIILLAASYFFYAKWDLRFLVILISLTVLNYALGFLLSNKKIKKSVLIFGLIINLPNTDLSINDYLPDGDHLSLSGSKKTSIYLNKLLKIK